MRIETSGAIYRSGAEVQCQIADIPRGCSHIHITLFHIENLVTGWQIPASLRVFCFSLPQTADQGYLLRGEALDASGVILDSAFTAVDCCESWTRFPRYGYIWDYTETADCEEKIRELNRYHLNGLQFYDWQYRHHRPMPENCREWDDWSGRMISGATLRGYILAAHEAGMVCMAYNMIYAANLTYLTDGSGVSEKWRLKKADGSDFTCDMDASRGPVGVLQYFNPLDQNWQRYIFEKENEAMERFGFDGWHGDTIGEMGPMTTSDGQPLGYAENGEPVHCVKDCYTQFLNAAGAAIFPRYLAFNPVGAQGIENVNRSRVDVLYTEFWPWDRDDRGEFYDDYFSIHRAIINAREQSGGKSLIVAGYINYKNPAESFNEPAVRLMDSVVFASGGSRIELGNGDGMLSNEYFPDDRHKSMSGETKQAVKRMYDFITAYENLLRDGQKPLDTSVAVSRCSVSETGRENTIWHFGMADEAYEVHHFINLIGTDDKWRDTEQKKREPVRQQGLSVKLYTVRKPDAVYLASPDGADLTPQTTDFETGQDDQGRFIIFNMRELVYWNMVFLR